MNNQAKVCQVCGVTMKGRKRADGQHFCANHKDTAVAGNESIEKGAVNMTNNYSIIAEHHGVYDSEEIIEDTVVSLDEALESIGEELADAGILEEDEILRTEEQLASFFASAQPRAKDAIKEAVQNNPMTEESVLFMNKGNVEEKVETNIIKDTMKEFVEANAVDNGATEEELKAIEKAKARIAATKEKLAGYTATAKAKVGATYTSVKEGVKAGMAFIKENGLWAGIKAVARRVAVVVKKVVSNEKVIEGAALAVVGVAGYVHGVACGFGVFLVLSAVYAVVKLAVVPVQEEYEVSFADAESLRVKRTTIR